MTKAELETIVLREVDSHKEKMESLRGKEGEEAKAKLAVHKTKFYDWTKFSEYLDELEDECCVHS